MNVINPMISFHIQKFAMEYRGSNANAVSALVNYLNAMLGRRFDSHANELADELRAIWRDLE